MAYFQDEAELYKYLGGVFREAGNHPEAGPNLRGANLTLKFFYSEPDCEMTVRFADDFEVIEGPSDEAADITLSMPADIADQYWRGDYNLAVGLAKGKVKAAGPVSKLLKLVPLTKPVFPLYRELTADKDQAAA